MGTIEQPTIDWVVTWANSLATLKPCERPRRRTGVPEKLVKLIFSYSFFPGFVYYSTKLYWACVSGKHVDNKTESESKIPCLQRVYILMNTDFKCILNLLNRSFIFVFKSYKILKGTKLRMVTILSLENSCLLMINGLSNHLQTK